MGRRVFWIAALTALIALPASLSAAEDAPKAKPAREAMYYERLDGGRVRCALCPNRCAIADGQRGLCLARRNIGGTLYAITYARPCSVHPDPIEKKPFFHVLPASLSYSIATVGCNMRCVFCQNWQISQADPEGSYWYVMTPEEVVEGARRSNCKTIAFTYTEPTVFYEYMLDTAKKADAKGVKSVIHSCGYINAEPLKELCKHLYAANVDLKGFTEEFYNKMGQGRLQPVLDAMKVIKGEGVWLEITNLVIPGANDDPETIRAMCKWIKENLGDDVPVHFSRFHPNFQLRNLPPTPINTLERARDIAQETGLKYVYIGNVPGHPAESTYCPGCKRAVVRRMGYTILSVSIKEGKCAFCGYEIKGRWE